LTELGPENQNRFYKQMQQGAPYFFWTKATYICRSIKTRVVTLLGNLAFKKKRAVLTLFVFFIFIFISPLVFFNRVFGRFATKGSSKTRKTKIKKSLKMFFFPSC
jgi:hypothetical protein